MRGLSAAELAQRAGTTADQVIRLSDLGILEPEDDVYQPDDVSRVRLAQAIDRAGISLDDMARAIADGHLSFAWFNGLLPQAIPLETRTVAERADELGLPMSVVERMFPAIGLPSPRPDDLIREDDARALANVVKVFESMGRDEDVFAGAARAIGVRLREIAESQGAFFRSSIIDRLFEQGLSTPDVIRAADQVATEILPPIYPGLRWIHARHLEAQWVQLFVGLVEDAMEEAGFHHRPEDVSPAVAFLDLSGFTALTEASGDAVAVQLADSLMDLAQASALSHAGRVVKLLGDGAMLHFPHPRTSVACGLELVDRIAGADLPPARVGIHAGPMVFRDGDYFGRAVNTAARIADYARPREVLASDAVVANSDVEGIEFEEIGPVSLKGVADPMTLHSARSATAGKAVRPRPGAGGSDPPP